VASLALFKPSANKRFAPTVWHWHVASIGLLLLGLLLVLVFYT